MLGLSDFVMDIETIDAASLIANAEKLWHRRQEVRVHLQAVLPQIRTQLGEYSRLTMQGMAK
jgi:polysaccharide pyruvyl transferase WcaK-like protein